MHQRAFLLLLLASSTTAGGALRRRRKNKADGISYAQTTNTNDAQIYDNESPINDGSTRRHLYESNKPSSDANDNIVLINKHARVLTTDYGDDIIITTLDDNVLLDDDISTALSPTEAPTYTVVWALDDDDFYNTTPDPTYAPVTPTESPTYDNLNVGTVDDSPPTVAPTYTVVTSLDDDMLDDDDLSTYYSPTEAPTYIAVGSLDDDVTLDDDDVSTASTPTQSPSYVPTSYHPTYYPTYSPT